MLRNLAAWCALALVLLFGFAPNAAAQDGKWLRTETPHFIFYSDGLASDLRQAAQSLESFDTILRNLLQPEPAQFTGKLEIYVLHDPRLLRVVVPGLSDDVRGLYRASPDIVAAFAIYTNDTDLSAQEVLFHEYTHHFMLANFVNAYPTWYVEGFAEFLQTTQIQPTRAVIGNYSLARAPALRESGPWLPMTQLLNEENVMQMSPRDIDQFYAQSWVIVHYLETHPEAEAGFRRYIAALRSGGDAVQSFQPAFGMTPDEFQTALHRYVSGVIPRYAMPLTPINPTALQVTHLSSAADELLPLVTRMRYFVPQNERAALAAQVEAIAARFPDDPFAVRARARAALLRGAPEETQRLLAPLTEAGSTDTDALYLMGKSYLDQANAANSTEIAARARHFFAQAVHVDSDNVPALYRYVQTYQFGTPMPDSVIDVLLKAHLLAPQVSEISINAALALMYTNSFDDAATILRPIAYAPHPDADTPYLRQMLDAAEHHRLPPPRDGAPAPQPPP